MLSERADQSAGASSAHHDGGSSHPLVRLFEQQCDAAAAVGEPVTGPLLKTAERVVTGRMVLPGSGPEGYDVGTPPDWRFDPVGDDQVASALNRCGHWVLLLRAWRLSGRADYIDRVRFELSDWIASCPCPLGEGQDHTAYDYRGSSPWRLLDAGIRMMGPWPTAMRVLREAGELDAALWERALAVCGDHARVLAVCVPIDSRPHSNNHLLMEMLGLLYTAVALPATPRSEADRQLAVAELCRAADEQVTAGGAQAEGCPHYHNLSLGLLAHAVGLLRLFEQPVPEKLTGAVGAMADYALHACRPTGVAVPWGDSDATASAWSAARWALAATGDDTTLRRLRDLAGLDAARRVLQRGVFDVPVEDRGHVEAVLEHGPAAEPLPHAWIGTQVKQASLRTGWSADAWHLFLGCHTPTFGTHAHADPAGFELSAAGVTPLPDPGRFTYAEGEDRRNFKSSRWHNTLTVNGREPFEYRGTWAYGSQREGRLTGRFEDDRLMAVACEHDSYHPVVHRRLCVLRSGGEGSQTHATPSLVVVDWLIGLTAEDRYELWFHLDSLEVEVRSAAGRVDFTVEGRRFTLGLGGKPRVETLPGQVSPKLDQRHASTRLRLNYGVDGPAPAWVVTRVDLCRDAEGAAGEETRPRAVEVRQAGDALQLSGLWGDGGPVLAWSRNELEVLDERV